MDHYRCYLDAELAKLDDRSWAQELVDHGACAQVHPLFRGPGAAIAERLASQEEVNAFVRGLSDRELVELTTCLSIWRKNPIRHELSPSQRVYHIEAPLERLWVAYAEPEHQDAWRELGHRLLAIAFDPRVPGNRETKRTVTLPCLAKAMAWPAGSFWVVDGVHRAIQVARNGDNALQLCVYEPG
jgi:hypothetical protein